MTPKNASHFQRALEKIPWGTQTNAKRHERDGMDNRPPFIQRAKGCRMWDLDGKEFIDYRAALGPIVLGYAYPEIDEAVRKQLEDGVLFSMASPLELEAAEAILETVKWPDQIRFMKTGADVCASCLRLARSHSGRDHFLTSGYHGYQDWFALGWPKPGIPKELNDFVHPVDYGDLEALDRVFEEYGEQLAAAHVVPVEWNRPPSQAYLERLRQRCDEHETVLIFDEVLTGFRLGKRGAVDFFGVTPDLSAYAKGIANGYPLSAYAGKREIMDTLNQTIITTTYAGETLSLAAAKAVMEVFQREDVHAHLFSMGQSLRDGFDQIFAEFGYPAQTVGLAPAVTIHFDGTKDEADKRRRTLFNNLFEQGIFANNEWFITYSHQKTDIDETLDKMRRAVRETL